LTSKQDATLPQSNASVLH